MFHSDYIPIAPYEINKFIHYIRISICNFRLNSLDCWVVIHEYDGTYTLLNTSRVYINSYIYSKWGKNDDCIIDYALDQLGFERQDR